MKKMKTLLTIAIALCLALCWAPTTPALGLSEPNGIPGQLLAADLVVKATLMSRFRARIDKTLEYSLWEFTVLRLYKGAADFRSVRNPEKGNVKEQRVYVVAQTDFDRDQAEQPTYEKGKEHLLFLKKTTSPHLYTLVTEEAPSVEATPENLRELEAQCGLTQPKQP